MPEAVPLRPPAVMRMSPYCWSRARTILPPGYRTARTKELCSMRSAVPRRPDRDHTGLATLHRLLMAFFTVAFFAIATTLPVAAKGRPPGGVLTNPVVRAIDVSMPAVVRIATLYSAHLTLSACGL